MTCVKSYWDQSWKLFADAVTSPRFDEKEFGLMKGQAISAAKEAESDPDTYLKNKSLQNAFPGGNYGKSTDGSVQSLERMTFQDVITHYNGIMGKQNIFLVVVGNIKEADLKQKVASALAKLPQGKAGKSEARKEFKPAATIENRDIATNYIRGTMSALAVNEKDGVPMMLAWLSSTITSSWNSGPSGACRIPFRVLRIRCREESLRCILHLVD